MSSTRITLTRLWDVLVWAVATAVALYVPVELVLGFESERDLIAIEWLVTLVFAADLVARYKLRDRPPVEEMSFHVQSAGWRSVGLTADVLALFPSYLLLGSTPLLLLRLLKLYRVAQMMRQMRIYSFLRSGVLRLLFFLYWLGLSSHWIACGWVALLGDAAVGSSGSRYLSGLYWCVTTLTTVGYGDIVPATSAMRIYTMGVMVLGVGMYGFIIGNIATILSNIDPVRASYLRRMEELSAFMDYRELPDDLRQRINSYHRYLWQQRFDHDETEILKKLPADLSSRVALFLKRDLLEAVPLFHGVPESFIREIAVSMQPMVCLPGDYVIRTGDRGRAMYFISRGRVEVLSADETEVYRTLSRGDFFGELALVFSQRRTASVRALEHTDLYRLDRELFEKILVHYPEIGEQIEARARQLQNPERD